MTINPSDLRRALIGIEPLPLLEIDGVTYGRRHDGAWTWAHPANKTHGHDCIAIPGSTKAIQLDRLLYAKLRAEIK